MVMVAEGEAPAVRPMSTNDDEHNFLPALRKQALA